MKIALVALPEPEETSVEPPLPLAYIAAMLEQQRHIVRIYDLALCDAVSLAEALAPLRTFRPHIIAIAATDPRAATAATAALSGGGAAVLHLGSGLRAFVPGQTIASNVWRLERQSAAENDQNLIFSALLALDDDLDTLPFPARHLLPLEQYPLSAPTGELQTTVLAGQIAGGKLISRNPALLIAELHSIAREHGVHHIQFLDPPLTHDLVWLRELLHDLVDADLGMRWEGVVRHQCLSSELLDLFRRAGCEALCFEFNAVDVLDSREQRTILSELVAHAHELGMWVRAQIELAPPYGAISALVDMSATFGLDDVRFNVKQRAATQEQAEAERTGPTDVAEMAHLRYRSRRSRQLFIQRFGPQLGPMLWRAGRAGLLGRAWQYYADGAADRAPV